MVETKWKEINGKKWIKIDSFQSNDWLIEEIHRFDFFILIHISSARLFQRSAHYFQYITTATTTKSLLCYFLTFFSLNRKVEWKQKYIYSLYKVVECYKQQSKFMESERFMSLQFDMKKNLFGISFKFLFLVHLFHIIFAYISHPTILRTDSLIYSRCIWIAASESRSSIGIRCVKHVIGIGSKEMIKMLGHHWKQFNSTVGTKSDYNLQWQKGARNTMIWNEKWISNMINMLKHWKFISLIRPFFECNHSDMHLSLNSNLSHNNNM